MFFFILFVILLSSQANAKLAINVPEKQVVKPGQLKVISIEIKNESKKVQDIKPALSCPKDWKLLIPLSKFKLPALRSKKINLIIQIPKHANAGPKQLNLGLITNNRKYDKNIKFIIKKIKNLKTGYAEVPKYVEKNFKVKFELINKGNTTRELTFFSNELFTIKNKKIEIKPYKNRLIEIKCKNNTPVEKPLLIIKARDQHGKLINIIYKKVQVLNNKKYNIYKNYLKYTFNHNGDKKIKRSWILNSEINNNLSLKLSNKIFNLKQKQDSYYWQLGTDYNPRFKLAGTKSADKHLRFSYSNNKDKAFKRSIYTDFNSELGAVVNLKSKRFNIYAETKKSKERSIDYYLNTHYKYINNHLNLHTHKIAEYYFRDLKLLNNINKNNRIYLGYSCQLWPSSIIKKKYFRYIYDNIKNRLNLEYRTIHNKKSSIKKFKISKTKRNIWNNFDQVITLQLKDKSQNYHIDTLSYQVSNEKYCFLLEKQFRDEHSKLFYRLTRVFNKSQINARISVDNFGKKQINLNGELDCHLRTGQEVSLNGKLIYDQINKKSYNQISMGILIPFTLKLPERKNKKVCGRVITSQGENVRGAIISINGVKVKTGQMGKFKCYVKGKQDLIIKVLDLGRYSEKYLMSKTNPYLIENYNNKPLKLKLVRYGSLQVDIKKQLKQRQNKYLQAIRDKAEGEVYIKLYNKDNCFIKKYKGHSPLKFDKIPPDRYKLSIENNSNKYNYTLKRKVIKINSGKNRVKIKQKIKNNQDLKIKEGIEEIKIKN